MTNSSPLKGQKAIVTGAPAAPPDAARRNGPKTPATVGTDPRGRRRSSAAAPATNPLRAAWTGDSFPGGSTAVSGTRARLP
jgi:hypothetical protein